MLSCGMKCYHLGLTLSSGTICYHLGWKCYHLELMVSSGPNVIIWDEMLSSGANVIFWDKMLWFGANVKIGSSGGNVIIWCYHVMLPAGMITHPFFIFPENFTHSIESPIAHGGTSILEAGIAFSSSTCALSVSLSLFWSVSLRNFHAWGINSCKESFPWRNQFLLRNPCLWVILYHQWPLIYHLCARPRSSNGRTMPLK